VGGPCDHALVPIWWNRPRIGLLVLGASLVLAGCSGPSVKAGGSSGSHSPVVSPSVAKTGAALATWTIAPVVSATMATCSTTTPTPAPNHAVCSADGKTRYVLGAGLTGRLVDSASFGTQSAAAAPTETVVRLSLVPSARGPFAQMTASAAHAIPYGQIAIVLDGRALQAPQVEGSIPDGQMQLCCYSTTQAQAIVDGHVPTH